LSRCRMGRVFCRRFGLLAKLAAHLETGGTGVVVTNTVHWSTVRAPPRWATAVRRFRLPAARPVFVRPAAIRCEPPGLPSLLAARGSALMPVRPLQLLESPGVLGIAVANWLEASWMS